MRTRSKKLQTMLEGGLYLPEPPKILVCNILASCATLNGFGLLFYLLLGSRQPLFEELAFMTPIYCEAQLAKSREQPLLFLQGTRKETGDHTFMSPWHCN